MINDLLKVTSMQATMFADDACFTFGHACSKFLEDSVNVELVKISKWFSSNKLTLNVDKTCFLLIHRKREQISLGLKLNGTSLAQKNEIKYLGVTIDQKLNWKSHINYCTAKLSKCLWAITRLCRYTNTPTLKIGLLCSGIPIHTIRYNSIWRGL